MPLPTAHPVVKTETEIRRSIQRLEVYRHSNALDEIVADGTVSNVIEHLKKAHQSLPKELKELV